MPKKQDDNSINKHIRKKILEARKEANEDQSVLAKLLDKSRGAISYMENGETSINASTLARIAHHYNKSITYFFPSDLDIPITALEEELLQHFKQLPATEQFEEIDYIKQKIKRSKKGKRK